VKRADSQLVRRGWPASAPVDLGMPSVQPTPATRRE
jgi:hypothetical protein